MFNGTNEKIIDGALFERMILSGVYNLKAHLQTVNDLNVFPIPDGDTGDNMYMTINGGIDGLRAVEENSVCKKAEALAKGMLFNARGNSGVILSQLFYGLSNGLKGKDTVTVPELGLAFVEGVKQAYTSVERPVEGTILTVARESAELASQHSSEDSTVGEFMGECVDEMHKSLDRTPELLPVLKEAGVIDSGGAGLLYITEGMQKGLREEVELETAATFSTKSVDFSKFNEDSEMTFGYCTECLLQLQRKKVDVDAFEVSVITDFLKTIGDSIVAFKTGTVIKLHVHTLTPYKVLEFCQQFGEFLTIKIENMTLQHNETVKDEKEQTTGYVPVKIKRGHKKYAVVTVATGEGLISTFSEFGADVVIDGGQGKNPSIETFLDAFEEADADYIYVLPNNSNIIMAARQAAEMYDKSQIFVIESKNFGQAYAILSMLDYSCDDAEQIKEQMVSDMADVVTGMVTTSVRTTTVDGVCINEGEYIGFTNKTMLVSRPTKTDTLACLAHSLGAEQKGFIIVFYGADVTEDEKAQTGAYVRENFADAEFYEIDGGQEVYEYILIME